MTVIDMIIALQKLSPNMRVMLDIPNMGEMFKFVDIVTVEEVEIDNEDGISEKIVMVSPYQIDIESN